MKFFPPLTQEILKTDLIPFGSKIETSRIMDKGFLLRLSNFKSFSYLELEIPKSGVILLDGPNGAGKTTILDALSFVFYDNVGNSCYNRKYRTKKKQDPTWVEIKFPVLHDPDLPKDLTIFRQRRPNLIRISGENVYIEDPETAQNFINRTFGSYQAWRVGGYLRQDSICDFFTISSNEKLDLLQQLSLPDRVDSSGHLVSGTKKFEDYLNQVNQKISELTTETQAVQMKLKVTEEIYLQHYNRWAPLFLNQELWTREQLKEVFSSYNLNYQSENLVESLNQLSREVQIHFIQKIQKLENQISQTHFILGNLREKIKLAKDLGSRWEKLQVQLISIPETQAEISKLETEFTQLTEQVALFQSMEIKHRLLLTKAEIQRQIEEIPPELPKYSSEELDFFERILKGPTLKELETQIHEAQASIKYLKLLELFNQREKLVQGILALENRLKTYPKESSLQKIEETGRQIWALSLQEKKLICPKCSAALYLEGIQLKELLLPEGIHLQNGGTSNRETLNQLLLEKMELQKKETLFQERKHYDFQLEQLKKELETFDSLHDLRAFSPQEKPKLSNLPIYQLENLIVNLTQQMKLRANLPDLQIAQIEEERKTIQRNQFRAKLVQELEKISREIEKISAGNSENSLDQNSETNRRDFPEETQKLEVRRREIRSQIQNLRLQEATKVELRSRLNQIEEELKSLNASSGNLNLEITQVSDQPNLLNEPLNKILNKLELQKQEQEQLQEILHKELEKTKIEKARLEKQIDLQIKLVQLEELKAEHSKAGEKSQLISQRLSSFIKIRSSLCTAEYILLDSFLNQLNRDLAELVGALFDRSVDFSIHSIRQLKTDDRIRPQINYRILIDDVETSNINEISGGERSRISFALAAAFSKYTNVPFLLLDESLSTLNSTNKESIMNLIRSYLTNKIVITVNHDTTTGVYDHVIKLE